MPSGSGVLFGVYASPNQSSDLQSSGTIGLTCDPGSNGLAYTLRIRSVQNDGGTRNYLSSGSDKLYYNLFLDSSRLMIWGDGLSGTSTYQGTTSASQTISVYGSVYKNQNVMPGSYADSPTIDIQF
jgi:spore coat protein U-like protein